MPVYEYECGKCGVFETSQRIVDPALTKCPTCRRKVRRLISNTSFQLKGSGWYVTDYPRGGGKKDGDGDGKAAAPSESSGEAKSDAKSDPKSDPKSDTKKSKAKSESKSASKASPGSSAATS
jgi:putative FmdB family regulatory protein